MDDAKKKILARRATFVAATLASLGAEACGKDRAEPPEAPVVDPAPCLKVAPAPCLSAASPPPPVPDAGPAEPPPADTTTKPPPASADGGRPRPCLSPPRPCLKVAPGNDGL